MVSPSTLHCTAFNTDGTRCSCTHWSKRTRKDQCRGCHHSQTFHQPNPPTVPQPQPPPPPYPTISSIVANVAARKGPQPRVTEEEAYLEATSGFRPKRVASTASTGAATSSQRRAGPSQVS